MNAAWTAGGAAAPLLMGMIVLLVMLIGWRVRPQPAGRRASLRPAAGRTRQLRRRWRRRRAQVDPVALGAYLEAIAREVRTGSALPIAFGGPIAPTDAASAAALAAPRRMVADGLPLGVALAEAGAFDRQPDLALAVQALRCAAALGGPAAATLDAAAAVLRERAAVAADVRAQSAQARLSARVLTVVPVAFAMWTVATSARGRQAMIGSAIGSACVGAGACLNIGGWWWMRRIVDRGER